MYGEILRTSAVLLSNGQLIMHMHNLHVGVLIIILRYIHGRLYGLPDSDPQCVTNMLLTWHTLAQHTYNMSVLHDASSPNTY